MRKVRGLRSVEEVEPRANLLGGTKNFAPSAGAGLKFEKDLACHLAELGFKVKHGQWFKYRDAKGVAYCQTDILALPPGAGRLLVFECKLTQKIEGELKLDKLYVPLMRQMYKLPTFAILAFKNILWEPELRIKSVREALELPRRLSNRVHHLHWSALQR